MKLMIYKDILKYYPWDFEKFYYDLKKINKDNEIKLSFDPSIPEDIEFTKLERQTTLKVYGSWENYYKSKCEHLSRDIFLDFLIYMVDNENSLYHSSPHWVKQCFFGQLAQCYDGLDNLQSVRDGFELFWDSWGK